MSNSRLVTFSIAPRILVPSISSQGVVIICALGLTLLISSIAVFNFSSETFCVLLKITVPACSIWLLKNSPKFFIYTLTLDASATVEALLRTISFSMWRSLTALITSESLPTPEGSIIILSGWYLSTTSLREVPKSPTSEQQMHPEFISLISTPESLRNPPSIPISPNSFSIRTTCSPFKASFKSLLIRVVLPAPKKPEIISTLVILINLSAVYDCPFISYFQLYTSCQSLFEKKM